MLLWLVVMGLGLIGAGALTAGVLFAAPDRLRPPQTEGVETAAAASARPTEHERRSSTKRASRFEVPGCIWPIVFFVLAILLAKIFVKWWVIK